VSQQWWKDHQQLQPTTNQPAAGDKLGKGSLLCYARESNWHNHSGGCNLSGPHTTKWISPLQSQHPCNCCWWLGNCRCSNGCPVI